MSVLEDKVLIKALAGLVPSVAVRESLLQASCLPAGGLLVISGVPWLLELCLHLHMALSWGVSAPKFPLFIRTAVINMIVDRVLLCSGMTSS